MNLRILDEAQQDLIDGFRFYEKQEAGLGDIFLILFFQILILCKFTLLSIP